MFSGRRYLSACRPAQVEGHGRSCAARRGPCILAVSCRSHSPWKEPSLHSPMRVPGRCNLTYGGCKEGQNSVLEDHPNHAFAPVGRTAPVRAFAQVLRTAQPGSRRGNRAAYKQRPMPSNHPTQSRKAPVESPQRPH